MADEPTPTVVDPVVPDPVVAPVVDPLADAQAAWRAQTNTLLERIGQLEATVTAIRTTPRSATDDPDHPLAGARTPAEVEAKLNELWFSNPTKAAELAWAIKAGPVIQERDEAQAEQVKKVAFSHPVYGPLLENDAIRKTFEEGWRNLPTGQRIHERAALETAAWAAGRHMDIVTKRAGDAAVVEERKRAPSGHAHAPSAAVIPAKEPLAELSQEEKEIARKLGVDEKDYATYKGR